MDQVSSWLYTNAPAAWLSALIACASLLYVFLTRNKPKRLVARELAFSSLVNVEKSAGNKIQVFFGERLVKRLGQFDIEITNEGKDVISAPKLFIRGHDTTEIIHVAVEPDAPAGCVEISGNSATLTLPFVNSHSDHKQLYLVSIVVDGLSSDFAVSGGGEGWSVRHVRLPSRARVKKELWLFTAGLVLLFLTALAYISWVETNFGIPRSELSIRAFVVSVPFLTTILSYMYFVNRWLVRRVRTRRPAASIQSGGTPNPAPAADA